MERTTEIVDADQTVSVVRFTDFVADAGTPSDESLSYYQSSATADSAEMRFMPSPLTDEIKRPAATFSGKVAAGFEIFCVSVSLHHPVTRTSFHAAALPKEEAVRKSEITKASVMHLV